MQELHPRIYVACLAAYNNGQLHGDSLPKLATEAAARFDGRGPFPRMRPTLCPLAVRAMFPVI